MAVVIVALPRWYPRAQRQQRPCSLQSLDLALLINREHQGFLGRIEVQRYDWTCPDFVDTLLCYGLAQRILFVLSRCSVAQVRV